MLPDSLEEAFIHIQLGEDLQHLSDDHINGYNIFIESGLDKSINTYNPYHSNPYEFNGYTHYIDLKCHTCKVKVEPNHTPSESIQTNLHYAGDLYFNVTVRFIRFKTELGYKYSDLENEILNNNPNIMVKIQHENEIKGPKIPILKGSMLCTEPTGERGFFITKGIERVINYSLRPRENYFCSNYTTGKNEKNDVVSKIRSVGEKHNSSLKELLLGLNHGVITASFITLNEPINVLILIKALYHTIPDSEKVLTDADIIRLIGIPVTSNLYQIVLNTFSDINSVTYTNSSGETHNIYTPKDAFEYIITKINHKHNNTQNLVRNHVDKQDFTRRILETNILPHYDNNVEAKINDIIYEMHNIICIYSGVYKGVASDSLVNKRIDTAGEILHSFFRSTFNTMFNTQTFRTFLRSSLTSFAKYTDYSMPPTNIHDNLTIKSNGSIITALTNGNFSVKKDKTGGGASIAQQLKRDSYRAMIDHLCRVCVPISEDSPAPDIRLLNGSMYGFFDPINTPDSKKQGLVVNKTIGSIYSVRTSAEGILKYIDDNHNITPYNISNLLNIIHHRPVHVKINGRTIGLIHENVEAFYHGIRKLKGPLGIQYNVDHTMSVMFDRVRRIIRISTEHGRIMRPVFKLYNYNNEWEGLSWMNDQQLVNDIIARKYNRFELAGRGSNALANPIVEYIDVEEQTQALIMNPDQYKIYHNDNPYENKIGRTSIYDFNYAEISNTNMFGFLSSAIPFMNHNPAARNGFQVNMSKKALSIYAKNQNKRCDTSVYNLVYPERPLCTTYTNTHKDNVLSFDGAHLTVDITIDRGDNQEDSLSVNSCSVDKGLLLCFASSTVNYQDRNENTVYTSLSPDITQNIKTADYSKLQSYGLPAIHADINSNDAIIGRFVEVPKQNYSGDKTHEDISIINTHNERRYVEQLRGGKSADNSTYRMITFSKPHMLNKGDKMSSRSGQKGTVSGFYPSEMMLRDAETGDVADIVINMCGFPSRMTLAQILETLFTQKLFEEESTTSINGSVGSSHLINSMIKQMRENKDNVQMLNRPLLNPITGEITRNEILRGTVYYNRSSHIAIDKYNGCGIAKISDTTHQPVEGKAENGGLKLGHMERGVLAGHGATNIIQDRFFYNSDHHQSIICSDCGITMVYNNGGFIPSETNNGYICNYFKSKTSTEIAVPDVNTPNYEEVLERNSIRKHTIDIQKISYCRRCGRGDTACVVNNPYNTKTVFDLYSGCNIYPKINVKQKK